ncbi:MAG: GTP 3',8-cyclase MoaA [Janthinobacterium lividum]
MNQKIIPIVAADAGRIAAPRWSDEPVAPVGELRDRLARPLRDLRISVTDRCNFRCVYCMPKQVFGKDFPFLPHASLLSFEEIERLARIAVAHGVEKIRLTGGEPLLRKNLENLVGRLAALRTPAGRSPELTLTTNGSLLRRKARALADAGLTRVTVSLDALDETRFRQMNDVDFPVAEVLDGIAAARDAGLGPIKVNMVVKRGVNDDEIVPMARYFHGSGVILRFIEYMDVGESNGWRLDDTLPSREIISRISAAMPLIPTGRRQAAETAERWIYADGGGEIGVISSVTKAFCGACTRARLSTEGKLFLCLFGTQGYDLRALLRSPEVDDARLSSVFAQIWQQRDDRYSELRGSDARVPRPAGARVEMSYIGG